MFYFYLLIVPSIPDIVTGATTVNPNKTSVSLGIAFDSAANQPGKLYCAAFSLSFVVTTSDVVVTNGVASSYSLAATSSSVTVTSLLSLTTYNVYCVLKAVDGTVTPLDKTLSSQLSVTTSCCKSASWISYPTFTYNDGSAAAGGSNVYSYALSSLPSTVIAVVPYVTDMSDTLLSSRLYTISPLSISFSNLSKSNVGRFSLSFISSEVNGNYKVKLNFTGANRQQYDSSSQQVSVIDVKTGSVPQPKVVYAVMSDSGSSVIVMFDSPTNRAGITSTTWPCSQLFEFQSASSIKCTWLNTSAVSITDVTNIGAGQNVTIFMDLIGPFCSSTSGCSASARLSATTAGDLALYDTRRLQTAKNSISIVIRQPFNPRLPVPVLVIPSSVLSCSSFTVNPSQSSGNGNKQWSKVIWSVSSSDSSSNSANLQEYLSGFINTASIITVPAGLISSGTYFVTLLLTNTFNATASTTVTFVSQQQEILPTVSIAGPLEQYFKASETVRVVANAAIAICGNSDFSASITLRWRCSGSDSTENSVFTSVSRNPRVFELAPQTLSAGRVYSLEVTASLSSTLLATTNSTARTSIIVTPGKVVAIVPGGDNRQISEDTTLSGGQSYDENAVESTSSPLSFQWSCSFASSQKFGLSCNNVFSSSSSLTANSITVQHSTLTLSDQYSIVLTVTSQDGRSGSKSILIGKLNSTVASSSAIKSTFEATNSQFPLSVYGFVQAPVAVTSSWQAFLSGTELDLQSMTVTPIERNFTDNSATNSVPYPLQLNANDALFGSTAIFRLSSYRQGTNSLLSYSDIMVVIAPTPVGGSLSVTPSQGVGFNQLFTMVTSSWVDDSSSSYPLQYDFRYLASSSSVSPLTIQSLSVLSSATSTLPSGVAQESFRVTIIVRAFNYYQAFGTLSQQVTVTSVPSNFSFTSYLQAGIAQARNTSNNDLLLTTVNNVISIVTVVNCTAATASYCASLNRAPCSTVPQTCSSCQNGFSGIVGPSNTPCSSDSQSLQPIGGTCLNNGDCFYSLCVNGVCQEPWQTCPSIISNRVCSGNGRCVYRVNQREMTIDDCGIRNTNCIPYCECFSGYNGKSCELNAEQTSDRISLMSLVCSTLIEVTSTSNFSPTLLEGLISSLYTASADDLAKSTNGVCLSALQIVSDLAAVGYLNGTTASAPSNLFNTISNFVSTSNQSSDLDSVLSGFTQGILSTMVSGQYVQEFTTDKLRLQVRRDLLTSLEGEELEVPQTDAEMQYGKAKISFSFVNQSMKACDIGNGYSRFALGSWSLVPFSTNETVVSPMIRLESYPNSTSSSRNTGRAIGQAGVSSGTKEVQYTFTIPYSSDQSFSNRYTTTGLNESFPLCQELVDGVYRECPSCEISTYTNTTATFVCYEIDDICGGQAQSNAFSSLTSSYTAEQIMRRLYSITGDDDGGQLTTPNANLQQITAIGISASRNFVTVLSFNPLRIDPDKAKPVLAVVSTLAFIIIAGLVFFHRWDWDDHHQLMYLPSRHKGDAQTRITSMTKKLMYFADAKYNRKSAKLRPASGYSLQTSMDGTPKSISPGSPFGSQSIGYQPSDESNVVNFLDHVLPVRLKATGKLSFMTSFLEAAFRHHDMTSVFADASISNPRYMRWINVCLQALIMIFTDTLFFNLFFPDQGKCESFQTEDACLAPMNAATGRNLCTWEGGVVLEDVNQTITIKCTISQPPSDLTFTLLVAMLNFLIDIPISLMLDFIRLEICAKRPDLSIWGFKEFKLLPSLPEMLDGRHEISPIEETFRKAANFHSGKLFDQGNGFGQLASSRHLSSRTTKQNSHAMRILYDEHIPYFQETEMLIQEVRAFYQYMLQRSVPWKDPAHGFMLQHKIQAIERMTGIRVDSSPAEMPLIKRMFYRNSRQRLEKKILRARRRAEGVREAINSISDINYMDRSIALLQFFVLEQFSPFKQYALRYQYFPFQSFSPPKIHPALWLSGWIVLFGILVFCLYWILAWGLTSGNKTLAAWGINFTLVFIQEFIVSQLAQIFIIHVVAMRSIEPQLVFIYHILYRKAMDVLQKGEEHVDDTHTKLGQHLSPACRVANLQSCADLPASKVLRGIDDEDLDVCRVSSNKRLKFMAASFLAVPVILGLFLGEGFGQVGVQAILPLAVFGFIIANFYLFVSSLAAFIVIYALLVAFYIWKYGIKKPAIKKQRLLGVNSKGDSQANPNKKLACSTSESVANEQSTSVLLAASLPLINTHHRASLIVSIFLTTRSLAEHFLYLWPMQVFYRLWYHNGVITAKQKKEMQFLWMNMCKPTFASTSTSVSLAGETESRAGPKRGGDDGTMLDEPEGEQKKNDIATTLSASDRVASSQMRHIIDRNLSKKEKEEEFARFKESLPNEVTALLKIHWHSDWELGAEATLMNAISNPTSTSTLLQPADNLGKAYNMDYTTYALQKELRLLNDRTPDAKVQLVRLQTLGSTVQNQSMEVMGKCMSCCIAITWRPFCIPSLFDWLLFLFLFFFSFRQHG
ncbi:hypothetical protein EON65_18700 [archaeon]|nr:MAG: hypothetical protein EON65_18700 [archaeon]